MGRGHSPLPSPLPHWGRRHPFPKPHPSAPSALRLSRLAPLALDMLPLHFHHLPLLFHTSGYGPVLSRPLNFYRASAQRETSARPSVRPSVTIRSSIVSKQLNLSSYFLQHIVAESFYLSHTKHFFVKFWQGSEARAGCGGHRRHCIWKGFKGKERRTGYTKSIQQNYILFYSDYEGVEYKWAIKISRFLTNIWLYVVHGYDV